MTTPTFDTLRIAQALKEAGFGDGQAGAMVSAIQQSLGESVATKADLSRLEGRMDAALAELRADIYRALWVQGAGLLAVIAAAVGAAVAIVRAIS